MRLIRSILVAGKGIEEVSPNQGSKQLKLLDTIGRKLRNDL